MGGNYIAGRPTSARSSHNLYSPDGYLERLIAIEQQANDELQLLALEGLDSGEAIEEGPEYWEQKHRRLDERLKNVGTSASREKGF